MAMFVTRYRLPNGAAVPTTVYARDLRHLREVIDQRGLGEGMAEPHPYFLPMRAPKMPSELLEVGQLRAANHALTWVAMIAVKAGKAEAWELLNDRGVLHEMAHILHSQEEGQDSIVRDQVAFLLPKVRTFEREVPGVHPCWGGEVANDGTGRIRDYQAQSLARRAAAMEHASSQLGEIVKEATVSLQRVKDNLPIDTSHMQSPTARPGTRAFAEGQRQQGAAAKAAMVNRAMNAGPARSRKETVAAPAATARSGLLNAAVEEIMPMLKNYMSEEITKAIFGASSDAARRAMYRPYLPVPIERLQGAKVELEGETVGETISISRNRYLGFDLVRPGASFAMIIDAI